MLSHANFLSSRRLFFCSISLKIVKMLARADEHALFLKSQTGNPALDAVLLAVQFNRLGVVPPYLGISQSCCDSARSS